MDKLNEGIRCRGIAVRALAGRDTVCTCLYMPAAIVHMRGSISVQSKEMMYRGNQVWADVMDERECVWRGRETGECTGKREGRQVELAPNRALCRVRAVMGITLSTKVIHPHRLSLTRYSDLTSPGRCTDQPTNPLGSVSLHAPLGSTSLESSAKGPFSVGKHGSSGIERRHSSVFICPL